jgi:hypothetical protein
MAYTPNTPQGNQTVSATQPQILGNFEFINDAMLQDHAWPNNEIGGQPDGTHQQVSLPNRGDITSLLTGINAVMYANSGNLFSWNGAKNPVSGVVQKGTLALTPTPQTVATLPNDCIGMVLYFANAASSPPAATINQGYAYFFYMVGGVNCINIQGIPAITVLSRVSNNQLTANTSGGNLTSLYKLI